MRLSVKCRVIDLGLVEYHEAQRIQKETLEQRKRGEVSDTLFLLEHPCVITVGRGGSEKNILSTKKELTLKGVTTYKTDRGGDVTFHGPGQLVAYSIFDLREQIKDVHLHLRKLEEVVIRFIKKYKINGLQQEGLTGVWVDDSSNTLMPLHLQGHRRTQANTGTGGHRCSNGYRQKIASIGIGVSNWITYHGVAININTDLSKFLLIKPCGMSNCKITSLSRFLGKNVSVSEAKKKLLEAFKTVFNLEVKNVEPFPLLAQTKICSR